MSAIGKCACFYMWNLFSVVVFHRFMVDWRRGDSSSEGTHPLKIWAHFRNLFCVVVFHRSMVNRGCTSAIVICACFYIWNILGAVVFHTSMVYWRRGDSSSEGTHHLKIWAHFGNLFGIVVFHRYMVDWRGYVCHRYMCMLLYVKLIWCSGVS